MLRILFFTVAGFVAGYFLDRYLSDRHRGAGSAQMPYPAAEPLPAEMKSVDASETTIPTPPFKEAIPSEPDDLTQIKGIGPTFARRLKEAGIVTYRQLARTTPDDLEQRPGVDEWVEEAAQLAGADS